MNQSILVSIQHSVNQIDELTQLQKNKAINLCNSAFNLYRIKGILYSDYIPLSRNYCISFLQSRDYHVKRILVENFIVETDNSYNVANHVAKGYRFNPKFFTELNISSTETTFTYSISNKKSTISPLCSPRQDPYQFNSSNPNFLQNHFKTLLERLTFTCDIDRQIRNLSEIQAQKLTINENITDQFVYLTLNKKEYRYSLKNALKLATETGCDLIQFKDKFYLDDSTSFIENKSRQLNISYCQTVFNIKNKLFYCNRNDTNNRLDYNLTGLKKELFEYMLFDGEKLVELDIANAQFAIAAHLNATIDANFVENAKRGSLYALTESELNLSKGTGKELMFRVAFDKVRSNREFTQIRNLYPKYMSWADGYKKKHGYKMFANLLQNKEAEIMIDELLMYLISKGYEVFTIHDALRVKQSQAAEIKTVMEEYFERIGFKCHVRER